MSDGPEYSHVDEKGNFHYGSASARLTSIQRETQERSIAARNYELRKSAKAHMEMKKAQPARDKGIGR